MIIHNATPIYVHLLLTVKEGGTVRVIYPADVFLHCLVAVTLVSDNKDNLDNICC